MKLKKELAILLRKDRPETLDIVSWAASNGDRSENGDYIYGKKRLREIDKEIRALTLKLENSEVINPEERNKTTQIFFGATVEVLKNKKVKKVYRIVGVDESDPKKGYISWKSPLAKCLLKKKQGDVLEFETFDDLQSIKIIKVEYKKIT